MDRPLVLLVDDDMNLVNLVYAALGNEGYTVTAATYSNALAVGRFLHPSVILLDVPRLDSAGAIVTRQFRAEPRTAAIPIIALAASADHGHYPGLIADAVLRKPFLLSELCATLARWVSAV